MQGLLDKFCNILNTISSMSSFGRPATCSLAWEDTHCYNGIKGPPGGGCPPPRDSLAASTALSAAHLE